jgi:MOSC domain-containing protein YiiM
MRVVSVNVGLPREIVWRGRTVTTAIFKEPVGGRVALGATNLEGDRQADLSVHGGPDKAVYAYPVEHHAYWRAELPEVPLAPGAFGENLTTEGLDEEHLCVGDRLRLGSAELVVTQPRLPCYKLGIRFQRPDMVRRFLASRRTGLYLAVRREGDVGAGDAIALIASDPTRLSVAQVTRLHLDDGADRAALERAVAVEALPESWRDHFRARLEGRRR